MPTPAPIDSDSLEEALFMLSEITARARAMGLGLVKYPVADVERVCAVLTAGKPKLVREGKQQPFHDAVTDRPEWDDDRHPKGHF